MTYKTTAKQLHFRREHGSSSIRVTQRGYGGQGTFGDPMKILPTVREQYEQFKRRAREIDKELTCDVPSNKREDLRRELAECLRNIGNMRQVLQDCTRLAFETIFVQVANARLPKDTFLIIVEEARQIWRSEGYADFIPPPTQRQRKKSSRAAMRISQTGV